MQLLGRTYDYNVDDQDNNWADYYYIENNFHDKIVYEELTSYSEYWIRVNDFPYDLPEKPKEHLILLKKPVEDDFYSREELEDILKKLSKLGYHIFMNPISKQSRPNIWHMHLLKYE